MSTDPSHQPRDQCGSLHDTVDEAETLRYSRTSHQDRRRDPFAVAILQAEIPHFAERLAVTVDDVQA
jgi:hypothetical protein